jgi:hypothetical protein
MSQYISFFVKVEGEAHSRYRSPDGVYKVDVIDDKSPVIKMASAALHEAIDTIPFLQESIHNFSVKLFSDKGDHIATTLNISTGKAIYCGRATEYPECITVH